MAHRLWLIAYDVSDPQTRRGLEKTLLEAGQRVQESKFECWLDAAQIERLWQAAAAQIDPGTDSLHAVPLCASCQPDVHRLGGDGGDGSATPGLWIL